MQKVDNFRQDEQQPVIKKCDSNAKYNEYDLEPDGCKVRQDDHHQKDKQAHEIDDGNIIGILLKKINLLAYYWQFKTYFVSNFMRLSDLKSYI